MIRTSCSLVIALVTGLAAFSATAAEPPTDAQKDAIRSHCRGDFIKYCRGVEPGGLPALECLDQHMESLGEACQSAVKPVEQETGTGGSSGG